MQCIIRDTQPIFVLCCQLLLPILEGNLWKLHRLALDWYKTKRCTWYEGQNFWPFQLPTLEESYLFVRNGWVVNEARTNWSQIWKKEHQIKHQKVYSLPRVVKERERTDCDKFWLALHSQSAVEEHNKASWWGVNITMKWAIALWWA